MSNPDPLLLLLLLPLLLLPTCTALLLHFHSAREGWARVAGTTRRVAGTAWSQRLSNRFSVVDKRQGAQVENNPDPQSKVPSLTCADRLDWRMVTFIFVVLSYAVISFAVDATDEEAPWLVVLLWLQVVSLIALAVSYVRRYIVKARVKELVGSLPAWQVVILFSMYSIVGILHHQPGKLQQSLPSGFVFTIAFLMGILLDACDTNKFESTLCLSIFTACSIGAFVAQFIVDDVVIFEGFRQQDDVIWIGQLSRNDFRRSCVTPVLFLIAISLYECVFDDEHHERSKFVIYRALLGC